MKDRPRQNNTERGQPLEKSSSFAQQPAVEVSPRHHLISKQPPNHTDYIRARPVAGNR